VSETTPGLVTVCAFMADPQFAAELAVEFV
jgi:hypothetical protein